MEAQETRWTESFMTQKKGANVPRAKNKTQSGDDETDDLQPSPPDRHFSTQKLG